MTISLIIFILSFIAILAVISAGTYFGMKHQGCTPQQAHVATKIVLYSVAITFLLINQLGPIHIL